MDQLKRYCLTSKNKFYTVSIVAFIFGEIFGTMILMLPDEDSNEVKDPVICAIITTIVLLIAFVIAYIHFITNPRKRFKGRLQYFQQRGLVDYAISDVQRGVTKFNGKLLLGEYCIMGKGTGLIVFYNEIDSIYIKIHRSTDEDGSTTETWTLKIDACGKKYSVCNVIRNNRSLQDWADVRTFLSLKAPYIIIK